MPCETLTQVPPGERHRGCCLGVELFCLPFSGCQAWLPERELEVC